MPVFAILGKIPGKEFAKIKAVMPNTPQQMLLRGQNLLGYRHYADDVVNKFVERAAVNGVDVFRVFDAMNDVRNLDTAYQSCFGPGQARPVCDFLHGKPGSHHANVG